MECGTIRNFSAECIQYYSYLGNLLAGRKCALDLVEAVYISTDKHGRPLAPTELAVSNQQTTVKGTHKLDLRLRSAGVAAGVAEEAPCEGVLGLADDVPFFGVVGGSTEVGAWPTPRLEVVAFLSAAGVAVVLVVDEAAVGFSGAFSPLISDLTFSSRPVFLPSLAEPLAEAAAVVDEPAT